MEGLSNHLVFYDGHCGLCDRSVQFLLRVDHRSQFIFAPLGGETAQQMLSTTLANSKDAESVVLIENYRSNSPLIRMRAKAVFRILWILGFPWSLVGWLCYLPSIFFDWIYRWIAKHRDAFFARSACVIPLPEQKSRFLP